MSPEAHAESDPGGVERLRLVDRLCTEFEKAWRTGRPLIEDFLAGWQGELRLELLRELVVLDVLSRRQRGEECQAADYERFGELSADWLADVLAGQRSAVAEQSAPTAVRSPDPTPPRLKGFTFRRLLGRGGFGEVWLATDENLQQDRAVKVLPRGNFTQGDFDQLVEEARLMARLPRHRNRVQVHALTPGLTNCFLVMEYVEGGPLSRQTSPERPMAWERAARYVADVADGLGDVHALGVLHRDIKPANVLWDSRRNEALLSDFGIAAPADRARGLSGTAGYIAPELDGGTASPKSDVFSLAAALFCLVTGRLPFGGRDVLRGIQQASAGLSRPVAALSHVPTALEEAILAGLEPDPERRADLATFTARLRGAHLQALADRLQELSRRSRSRVNLRVNVSAAREGELVFRPVALEAQPLEPTRNMDLVPEPAPVAPVRTGDLVRLEVTADADGYLTVLNLGSSGEMKVVFPNPLARDNRLRAGQAQRLTVKLTPPAGTDRAAIIWTEQPGALTPAEWRERIEAGQVASLPPAESTRGMDFVLHEAGEQTRSGWAACVVAVSHRPA
jgi:serine/threonine protein kinase